MNDGTPSPSYESIHCFEGSFEKDVATFGKLVNYMLSKSGRSRIGGENGPSGWNLGSTTESFGDLLALSRRQ
jgi:hypothetical protein